MYISIPKEFFVPVLFSEDFRVNLENNSMDYDTEKQKQEISNDLSRNKLLDLNSLGNRSDSETIIIEEVLSKEDKLIQDQILDYIKGFMMFINELKSYNCLGKDEEASSMQLVNYYAGEIKNIYNDYKNLIENIKTPLHQSDIDGIVSEYINKIENVYNQNLKRLNCQNLNYDSLEATITRIIDDARKILREQIIDINCKINNAESYCKTSKEIENKFDDSEKFFNELDNEFIKEVSNT